MKVTYMERLSNHVALNRNKFCPNCGEHQYIVVEQLEPETEWKWSIRCPACGFETGQHSIKQGAMSAWYTKNFTRKVR